LVGVGFFLVGEGFFLFLGDLVGDFWTSVTSSAALSSAFSLSSTAVSCALSFSVASDEAMGTETNESVAASY
jgi:hypothetical protein